MSVISMQNQADNTKALADALKGAFSRGIIKQMVFTLSGPGVQTIKKTDGSYRKHPFKGGEEFRISTAYAGKKGSVIIVFSPKSPVTDYAQMEMSLDDAILSMGGSFKELIKDLVENNFQAANIAFKTDAQIQNEARAHLMADPRYGAF